MLLQAAVLKEQSVGCTPAYMEDSELSTWVSNHTTLGVLSTFTHPAQNILRVGRKGLVVIN